VTSGLPACSLLNRTNADINRQVERKRILWARICNDPCPKQGLYSVNSGTDIFKASAGDFLWRKEYYCFRVE
jgi:hypothetical protein